MANIMFTTGSGFEGYKITEYLGYVCGQTAIGNNILQGIVSGVQDSSDHDVATLERYNEDSMTELEKIAKQKKADAIIGLKFTYTQVSANSVAVIASGIAVKLDKIEVIDDSVKKELPVMNYYNRQVPRPAMVYLSGKKTDVKISVRFFNYNTDDIYAVRADVEFTNLYEEKLLMKDVDFVFDKGNVREIVSNLVDSPLTASDVQLLKEAKVTISKFVTPRGVFACNDLPINVSMTARRLEALKIKRGLDAVEKYRTDGMIWTCYCGFVNEAGSEECMLCGRKQESKAEHEFDYESMIAEMQTKEYVNEIKDVLMSHIKEIDPKYRMELLEIMESGAQYERTRGNMKESVIEKVEKVFE